MKQIFRIILLLLIANISLSQSLIKRDKTLVTHTYQIPQDNLVQKLTATATDSTLSDAIGNNASPTAFRGKGFSFNGTDNYLQLPIAYVGDSVHYIDSTNTKIGIVADANARVFVGDTVKVFKYWVTHSGIDIINYCEQSTIYGTDTILTNKQGEIHTVAGTLTTFFIDDDRVTYSDLNSKGYGTVSGYNGYIPLDIDTRQPVITADVVHNGRAKYNVNKISTGLKNDGSNYFSIGSYVSNYCWGSIFKPNDGAVSFLGQGTARALVVQSDGDIAYRTSSYSYDLFGVTIDVTKWHKIFVKVFEEGGYQKVSLWIDGEFKTTKTIDIVGGIEYVRFSFPNLSVYPGVFPVDKVAVTYFYNGTDITNTEAINWNGGVIKHSAEERLFIFNNAKGSTNNTVYDVNNDVAYTILGTITTSSWVNQDVFNYNNDNGFGLISGVEYPASQLNNGKDVLGNDLTNPAITNGLNSGCKVQYPIVPELIQLDTLYKIYTPAYVTMINSDFNDGTVQGWIVGNNFGSTAIVENVDNQLHFVDTVNSTSVLRPAIYKSVTLLTGHKYRVIFKYHAINNCEFSRIYTGGAGDINKVFTAGEKGVFEVGFTMIVDFNYFFMYFNGLNYITDILFDDIIVIDITQPTDVTARELEVSELPTNYLDKMFWNKGEFDNGTEWAKSGLWYNTDQDSNYINKVYKGMWYLIKK